MSQLSVATVIENIYHRQKSVNSSYRFFCIFFHFFYTFFIFFLTLYFTEYMRIMSDYDRGFITLCGSYHLKKGSRGKSLRAAGEPVFGVNNNTIFSCVKNRIIVFDG